MVVFGQSGCIRERCLYLVNYVCTQTKAIVFGKSGCIRAKRLYSSKVVVFGQNRLNSCKRDCIRKKVVVFRQSGCIRAKLVVFGLKMLYWGKVVLCWQ